jgi:hypothetical protein
MKRRISLILSFIILITAFSGCARIERYAGIVKPEGLVELETVKSKKRANCDIDIRGDILALLSSEIDSKDGFAYYVTTYDLKWNRLLIDKKVNCPLEDVWGCKWSKDDDSLLLYNEHTKKAAVYDRNLNFVEVVDYEVEDYEEVHNKKLESNIFIDDSMELLDCFARKYFNPVNGRKFELIAFYDESDCVYLAQTKSESVLCTLGNIALCTQVSDNYKRAVSLAIYDYRRGTLINTVSTEEAEYDAYPCNGISALSDKYAAVEIFPTSEGTQSSVYYWCYSRGAKPQSFPLERLDDSVINEKNKELKKELKDEYGIDVYYRKAIKDTRVYKEQLAEDELFIKNRILGAKPLDIYFIQLELQAFLERLPDGFVREIYTDYKDSESNHKSLQIFIFRRMLDDENVSAYAQAWSTDMHIAFATESFNTTQISHEFMHLIDYRIEDYYSTKGRNLYEEWEELNPEGFEYNPEQDFNEEYFPTVYAMTDQQEDRADLFMTLCDYSGRRETPDFVYAEGKLYKKAQYLCKAIRESFPSVKKAKAVLWERDIKVK